MRSNRLLALATACLATPLGAQIQSDDLLVNFIATGGVEVYRPDGTLSASTGSLTGSNFTGVVFTPEGLIATNRRSPSNGVNLIDENGTEVRSFATPQVTGLAGDIDVFSDGTLAVWDQGGDVELYDPLGTHLGTIATTAIVKPVGGTIDGNDELWMVDNQPSSGTVERYDRAGTLQASLQTNFGIGDLEVAPDGTLWLTGRLDGVVYHLDASGNQLGSFQAVDPTTAGPFYGIALASDGSLFVTAVNEARIHRYDSVGNALGPFTVGGVTPGFLRMAGSGSPGIQGTPDEVSVSTGGAQVLSIDVADAFAGKSYLVLGSASGTAPGVTYSGVTVPLNFDPYLVFTVLNPNTPLLNGSGGVLNSLGRATAVFTLPPAGDPALVGLAVHHAAVVLDLVGPALVLQHATDAAALELTP